MGFIGGIVNISIGAVLMGSLFITVAIKGANTTGTCYNTTPVFNCALNQNVSFPNAWGTSELALWGVLTIAGIVGLVVGTLNIFGIM